MRRVLNGASKFHGTSLNKSLLVGPDLLQNLISIPLQFRQHKYAVSADIEGMFLQVGVLARDQISLRDLVSLLKLGGFNFTKFVSNADEITSAMNPEDCETSSLPIKEIFNGAKQSSHVLGLKWDHVKDTLVVSRGVDRPIDKAITQRTVLRFVSSVFDPVGLVAPYTVRARILLRDIWKISGQSWDDELPEDIRDKFLE